MKHLPDFEYYKVDDLSSYQAIVNKQPDDITIVAGGTDLLIKLKSKSISPNVIVDISDMVPLREIVDERYTINIGAAATHTEIASNSITQRHVPFLAKAALSVGSTQIRNSGTIGGNIANACPAGDTLGPLVALDASIEVAQECNNYSLLTHKITEIFTGPYQTILKPSDLITKIVIEKIPNGTGTSFIKVGRRNALSIARLSIAVLINVDNDGIIDYARIAPGAVLTYSQRITRAEDFLIGKKVNGSNLFQQAGEITSDEVLKITGHRDSTPYKHPVLKNIVARGLLEAYERCTEQCN